MRRPTISGRALVRIANAFGSVTSAPARLEIRPTILTNPTNQTLIAGSKAQLSVRATGSTKLVYQWRKNGTNVINGVNVSGATSNVLTLTALATNNVGAYDVIITNRFGRTNSGVATLRVVSPFTISGRVWDGTNGVDGVRVAAAGTTNSDLTDSAGYYTVSGLKSNAYSVVPTAAGYRFDPGLKQPRPRSQYQRRQLHRLSRLFLERPGARRDQSPGRGHGIRYQQRHHQYPDNHRRRLFAFRPPLQPLLPGPGLDRVRIHPCEQLRHSAIR